MEVRPYDWKHYDYKSETGGCLIAAWCFDKNSNPILLRFEDNNIYAVLELPEVIDVWYKRALDTIFAKLEIALGTRAPISYLYKKREKLYYFKRGIKSDVMYLIFKNYSDVMKCKKLLSEPVELPGIIPGEDVLMFNFHEHSIMPHTRLMTKYRLAPCQWFKVEVKDVEMKISKIREYIADSSSIVPIDFAKSDKWQLNPLILAFDIETYSHKPKCFPNKNLVKDVVFNISLVHQRVGKPESRRSEIIVLGDVDEEDVEGDNIYKVDSEVEAINKFCELINKIDPDVVTGYNIFRFDYSYMCARIYAKLLSFPSCGRLYEDTTMRSVGFVIDKKRKYGKELSMSGRFNVDLFVYAKVTLTLETYKLDDVSYYLLGKRKQDVSPEEMFAAFKRQDAIKQEILKTDHTFSYKRGYKHKHKNDHEHKHKHSHEHEHEYELAKTEMTRVINYCIWDSALCIDLFMKVYMWTALSEEANVSLCNMREVHTMGKQKKIQAIISRECYYRNLIMDSNEEGLKGYEGGYVAEPVPGLKKDVCCVDFNSLYPTILIAFNICFTTLLHHLVSIDDIDPNDYTKLVTVHDGEVVTKYFRKNPKGIVPEILERLLEGRAKIRAQLRKEKDSLLQVILDKRQGALKVTANSVYGMMGASTGLLQLFFGAVLTTDKARESIKRVNTYLKKNNIGIVYGDTDSSMIDVVGDTPKELFEFAEHTVKELTKLFPKPMAVGIDWIAKDYLLICKKKYIARLYTEKTDADGNKVYGVSDKLYTRGVMMARRDSSKYVKEIGKTLVTMMFDKVHPVNIIDMVFEKCLSHMRSDVKWHELLTAVKVGQYDSDSSYFLAAFAKKMKALGNPIEPGSRVNYLIVKNKSDRIIYYNKKDKWNMAMRKKPIAHRLKTDLSFVKDSSGVGGSMVTEEYFKTFKSSKNLKPDRLSYLKKFINPLDQLFDVGFSDQIDEFIYKRNERIFKSICDKLGFKQGSLLSIDYEDVDYYTGLSYPNFVKSYDRLLKRTKKRKYSLAFSPMNMIYNIFSDKSEVIFELSYRVKKVQ